MEGEGVRHFWHTKCPSSFWHRNKPDRKPSILVKCPPASREFTCAEHLSTWQKGSEI